ncbi:PGF-pre-PGF domain-containing protein, partial [Methanosarcina sp. UBA411]|uniref:PGF-pre-PGF domain-containing protein n=1 Tax=Methanosarcina sp. UBA411 TaxID=1915589 RepID=UPI0025D0877D
DSDSNDGSSTPGSDDGDSDKGDSNSGSGDSGTSPDGTSPDNGNSGTKKSDTVKSDTVKSDNGDSDTQDSDRTSSDIKSPDTKNSDSGNSDTEDEDSDSSSGSGMNLVSSEKATNIAVKELSTRSVMGGYPARFEFIENVTCITKIEFDPKKTFRKTTTIVEELKNRSTLVPISPEGTVYKYVNIWVGDKGAGLPSSIRSGFVEFKVEKTWIKDNNISDARVILQRYDEEWQPLNTEKTGEDENYVYFKSETPGYSSFAITEYTGQTVKEVSGAGKIKETLRSLGSGGSLNGDTEKNSKIKNPMGAARIFMALSLPLFMLLIGYCILKKKI